MANVFLRLSLGKEGLQDSTHTRRVCSNYLSETEVR